jgi:putative DNA primase/helicase
MMIQGVWLAEWSELDAMKRSEQSRIKAIITKQEDAYVPKFSNNRVRVPRRTIFVGTTNEEVYFPDIGNTRFLPVRCGTIDIPVFDEMRDQLLAEARDTYLADPLNWWRMDATTKEEIASAREERRQPTVYEDSLRDWLTSQGAYVTWPVIAKDYLKIDEPEKWKDLSLQRQLIATFKALKWQHATVREGAKTFKAWKRPA